MVAATSPVASAKAHVAAAGPGKQKAQKMKHHKVSNHDPTIYDAIVNPSVGNLPSLAFQAHQESEIGNQITFAGTARVLDNVVVQMSSWVCGNLLGGTSCATTPGATFNEPITLNIYKAPTLGNSAPEGTLITPGALIATETKTFAIPYRPSADNVNCTGASAGAWYDSDIDQGTGLPIGCLNGLLNNITFNFGHVTLPNNIVYGIALNTTTWGYHPYGNANPCDATTSCGYDGLNVALTTASGPSVGSDPNPGTIYQNSATLGNYCDSAGPTAGAGTFRLDSPGPVLQCWEPGANDTPPYYIPSVQFNALVSPSPTITSAASVSVTAGTPFSFQVTTTGVPTPAVTKLSGKLPKGLVFTKGVGTATISGTALKTDTNKNYTITVQAKNARRSVARQRLTLTLTGGK
jgi:hypothetical protein